MKSKRIVTLIATALVLALAWNARAQIVALDLTGAKPGSSFIGVVNPDGKTVTIRPLEQTVKLAEVSTLPNPNPNPIPSPGSPFEQEVERITRAALAAGGTKTTGAAISSAYSFVADAVANGSILPANALPAVRAATDMILSNQADRAAWQVWRTSIGDALTVLPLTTKEQYVATLRSVSAGMNQATGFSPTTAQLVDFANAKIKASALAAPGILDGIDLAKLIELIRLILDLLKMFRPM